MTPTGPTIEVRRVKHDSLVSVTKPLPSHHRAAHVLREVRRDLNPTTYYAAIVPHPETT